MLETHANSPKPTASPALKAVQGLTNLALLVWAVRDIRRRPDDQIKGRRKVWLLAAFAPPIGPLAYFLFGRKHSPAATEIPLEISA